MMTSQQELRLERPKPKHSARVVELDEDFLAALPPDLRAEVVAAQQPTHHITLPTPHNTTLPSSHHTTLPPHRVPAPLSCSGCISQSSPAVSNCSTCQALLCARCVATTHSTGVSASHDLRAIDNRSCCSLCDVVFDDQMQYCVECNVGTCVACDVLLHMEASAAHQRRSRRMVDDTSPVTTTTEHVVVGGVVGVPALLDCNTKTAVRALISEWTSAFDEVMCDDGDDKM